MNYQRETVGTMICNGQTVAEQPTEFCPPLSSRSDQG